MFCRVTCGYPSALKKHELVSVDKSQLSCVVPRITHFYPESSHVQMVVGQVKRNILMQWSCKINLFFRPGLSILQLNLKGMNYSLKKRRKMNSNGYLARSCTRSTKSYGYRIPYILDSKANEISNDEYLT